MVSLDIMAENVMMTTGMTKPYTVGCTQCRDLQSLSSPMTLLHLCKLRTFFFFFLLPDQKNLIGCSYFLSKYHVKILQDKQQLISFYFTFCEIGILHVSLWGMA